MTTRKNPTKAELRKRVLRAAEKYATRYAWLVNPGALATNEARAIVRAVRATRRGGAL